MRYTPSYDAIKEARRADDDLNRGQWTRDLKVSNWRRVIELTVETLSSKSKDLQIAAWLTEALTIHNGFAGLRDGICLLRMLHERFWDSLYPALEDGDAELRAGILEWLNDRLPPLIRAIPLTAPDGVGPYSWLRWQESRAVEEAGRKKAQDKAALVAEGKITGEQFDKAVAASPQKLLEELLEDIRESFDENQKLAEQVDDRYGRDAPSLIGIKQALEDCRALVEDLLKKKQAPAAAPAQPPAAATAPNAPKPPPGAAPAAAPAQVRPAAPSPPAAPIHNTPRCSTATTCCAGRPGVIDDLSFSYTHSTPGFGPSGAARAASSDRCRSGNTWASTPISYFAGCRSGSVTVCFASSKSSVGRSASSTRQRIESPTACCQRSNSSLASTIRAFGSDQSASAGS